MRVWSEKKCGTYLRMWKHEMAVVSASHQVMLLAIGSQTRAPASGADGGGAGGGGGGSAHGAAPLERRSGANIINEIML